MPAFLLALGSMLGPLLSRLMASRLASWIVGALLALGISWGTQTVAVTPILNAIKATASGVTGSALEWLSFLNVDRAVTIVLSAYATRAGLNGARLFLKRRAG